MFDYLRQLKERNMEQQKIDLGCRVRDRVTGLTGIATSRSQHLTGCDTYWIDPGVDKDGKLDDRRGAWFDVQRLEILETCAQTGLMRMAPPAPNPSGISAG